MLLASVEGQPAVRVVNLSLAGAMILHREELAAGAAHVLFLRLSGMAWGVPARLVWSHPFGAQPDPSEPPRSGFRSGLHFADLPQDAERDLRRYLAALTPARP